MTPIAIDKLVPRKHESTDYYEQMRRMKISINECGGILSPLLVRPVEGDRYIIVDGSLRYIAARDLGYESLPCVIREMDIQHELVFRLMQPLSATYTKNEQTAIIRRMFNEFHWTMTRISKFAPFGIHTIRRIVGKKNALSTSTR